MTKFKLIGLAGLGIGIAFASGCITRGSGSFAGAGSAEPDISPVPAGENPMPAALSPVQPGNVRYPDPRPAKAPEYWQQHSDPYAGMQRPAPAAPRQAGGAPVASATSSSDIYVVRKGDILGRIARQHGVKVADLKAANGLTGDTIKVGQRLRIPAAKSRTAATAATAAATPGTYVVQKGDILGRIARQHGVKVADLKAANGLTGDTIKVGQRLRIPGKATPAAAPTAKEAAPAIDAKPAQRAVEPPQPARATGARPATDVLPPPVAPALPEVTPPSIDITPPEIDLPAQGFAPVQPAAQEITTYLASGDEDIYSIAISHTVGIPEAKRLNPQLAAEFDRTPPRKLPAGTPVFLPRK